MCGIVACRTQAPAVGYLVPALRRLEYRGYDSVGVAVSTGTGEVARIRTTEGIGSLEILMRDWAGPELDGVGIGHTRWATHGAVSERNAHPHTDCTGRISLVHNGIIENASILREQLIATGHRFTSDVDSEVICHLIENYLQTSDLVDAVQLALARLHGSWALAVLERGTSRLVAAANRSPLLIARTPDGDFAASDITAVADWAEEFRVMSDGDIVELATIHRWSNRGIHSKPPTPVQCPWQGNAIGLHGYPDYMAKEIAEQPEVAARVLDQLGGDIANGSLWTGLGLTRFDRMQVIACGTSMHAGLVIGNALRRVGGLPTAVTIASEAAEAVVEAHTLCLAISQSGETADVLRAVESRAEVSGSLLALTNNPHSTLARRADAVLACTAGAEIGVAATKTFVCQVIAGVAVMVSALVADRRLPPADASKLVDELRRLPDRLANSYAVAGDVLPPIANEVSTATGFVFLARGSGLPYAAEGALKLKELTYRWTECCSAGELKHGPLALIDAGTPVVVIDNADPRLSSNVAEIEARGGRIISIGATGSTVSVLEGNDVPWGPLEAVIPLQILARTLALGLGHDVDKPRNLAKSVTVE